MAVTITTGPTNLRIYQRSNETGCAAIRVEGAYVGTGTSVQYKIEEGAAVRQNWTAMGAQSVATASYSGYMVNVPCGDSNNWFKLSIRIVDAGGSVIDSTVFTGMNWTVGVLVLGAGQSNLSYWKT